MRGSAGEWDMYGGMINAINKAISSLEREAQVNA